MSKKLDTMLELERRGSLPEKYQAILSEARKRGLVPVDEEQPSPAIEHPLSSYDETTKQAAVSAFDYTAQKLSDKYRSEGKSVFESYTGEQAKKERQERFVKGTLTLPESPKEAAEQFVTGTKDILTGAKQAAAHTVYGVPAKLIDLGLNVTAEMSRVHSTKGLSPEQEAEYKKAQVGAAETRKTFEALSKKLKEYERLAVPPEDINPAFIGEINRAVGQAGVAIATIGSLATQIGSTGAMATLHALEAADQDAKTIFIEAGKGAMLGKVYGAMGTLAPTTRVATGGAVFGGQTALEGGTTEQIMAQTIVGAGLGILGPADGTTLRQALKDRVIGAARARLQREINNRMQEELKAPKLPNDVYFGDLTKLQVIEGLAQGDASVLPRVAEGVKAFGADRVRDEIFNSALGLAAKNKTLRQYKQIASQFEAMLQLGGKAEKHIPGTPYNGETPNISESGTLPSDSIKFTSEDIGGSLSKGRIEIYKRFIQRGDKAIPELGVSNILEPIVVEKTADGWKAVEGNHRLQAYRELGIKDIPVVEVPKDVSKTEFLRDMRKDVPLETKQKFADEKLVTGKGDKIAEEVDVIFNGKQTGGKTDLYLFTDKQTGTTFAVKELTKEAVAKRLAEKRTEFETTAPVGKIVGKEGEPSEAKVEPSAEKIDPETFNPIKISSLLKDIYTKLDLANRVGRLRMRQAAGEYYPFDELVRSRVANEFSVALHEVGHHLNKILFGGKMGKLPTKQFKPHREELQAIATKGHPLEEGFAEFFTKYIVDDFAAKKVAPKFYDYFDSFFRQNYPELHSFFLEKRQEYQTYQKYPAVAKGLSKISFKEPEGPEFNFTQGVERFYTLMIDDLNPIRELVREIETNRPLGYLENPYIISRLYRGWTGIAEVFLGAKSKGGEWTGRPIDFSSKKPIEGSKSLAEILEPVSDNMKAFSLYLVARRVMEQAGSPKKMGNKNLRMRFPISKAEAEAIIKEIETPKFKQAAEGVYKYNLFILTYLKESGILSTESYIQIATAMKNYVPLYRVMDDWTGFAANLGKGFTPVFDPVARQKAFSGRDIVDPLESIVKNTYAFVNLAEKQRVLRSVVHATASTEGMGEFIKAIPTPTKAIPMSRDEILNIVEKYGHWKETVTFKEFKKELIKKIGGDVVEKGISGPADKLEGIVRDALVARGMTEGEASAYIHKLKTAKTAVERNDVLNTIIEKETITTVIREYGLDLPEVVSEVFRPANKKLPNVIKVYTDGKAKYYEVNPELFKAISALDKESSNLLIRILSVPAKVLRAGATTFSPEFLARNPLRDQWMAFIQSKYGFTPGVDFVRGLFHVIRKDELYWEFKASGAEHSMLVSLDRKYLQLTLDEVVRRHEITAPFSIKSKIIRHPLEALAIFSEFGEKATRLGEFQNVKKRLKKFNPEMSDAEIRMRAGFEAREVTLDFARMGAKGQALNQIVAFWNARLQGLDKIRRTFKEDPYGATARTVAAVTIPELLLYYSQKDDPRWDEVPTWQKDLFFIIIAGPDVTKEQWEKMSLEERKAINEKSTIWRVPKPFEIGVLFGSLPRTVMEWAHGKDKEIFREWASNFLSSASPGVPVPTAFMPVIENYANWSAFQDRPIVPKYAQELEPQYQASGYDSFLAKKLGAVLNYSPAKIDHLIKGYTGGFGGLSLQAVDKIFETAGVIEEKPAGKPLTILEHKVPFLTEKTPIFRGFVVRYPNSNAHSLKKFYEIYEKTSTSYRTFNYLEKQGDAEELEKYYTKHEKDINIAKPMEQIKSYFTQYQLMVREIFNDESLTPEEKRLMTDEIYLEMIDVAERSIQNYKEF